MQKKSSKTAFSIIELSVVALIISALIGGVVAANRISQTAKLTAARSLTKNSPVIDIDNLVAWYETTMPQSFIDLESDNGNLVTTWYDLGPNHNNASGGIAPTYISDAINGLPALRFSGTQYFNFNGTSLAQNNYTIFVVEQRRAISGSGDFNFFIGQVPPSGSTNNILHLGYLDNTTMTFAQFGNDYNVTVPGYISPIPIIHTFRFSNTRGKDYYKNGGTPLIYETTGGALTGLTTYDNAAIAGYFTVFYIGDISEVILFNKTLSDNERKDIERYLSKKWRIVVS